MGNAVAGAPANEKIPGTEPGPGQAIYPIALGWQIFTSAFLVAMICATMAGIYFAMVGAASILAAVVVTIFLIVLASAAAWALVEMRTWRVTLASDAIEASSYWRTRRLRRDEIKGCRFAGSGKGGPVLVVAPIASDRKKISIALRYIKKDAAF